MGNGAPPTLRIPLILLALVDLTLLGMRLWPWGEVFSLPLNGATGIDPAVTLVGYVGLIWWIGSSRTLPVKKALFSGALLGVLGGLLLAGQVAFNAQPETAGAAHAEYVSTGLLVAAAAVWGFAGLKGSLTSGDAMIGVLAGAWSAMASCLIGCTAVLAMMYLAAPVPQTTDPWRLYEGLAIGNPATQALVQSLNRAMGFLLLGPLAGGALGLVFGFFGQSEKK